MFPTPHSAINRGKNPNTDTGCRWTASTKMTLEFAPNRCNISIQEHYEASESQERHRIRPTDDCYAPSETSLMLDNAFSPSEKGKKDRRCMFLENFLKS